MALSTTPLQRGDKLNKFIKAAVGNSSFSTGSFGTILAYTNVRCSLSKEELDKCVLSSKAYTPFEWLKNIHKPTAFFCSKGLATGEVVVANTGLCTVLVARDFGDLLINHKIKFNEYIYILRLL